MKVIFKANFKPAYKQVSWTFWYENSDLPYSFSFYFLQELSDSLIFEHCCWYSNDLMIVDEFKLQFDAKTWLKHFNLFEIAVTVCKKQCSGFNNSFKKRRKMSMINQNFQFKKFMTLVCALVWNLPSKSPSQSLIFCEM